jgi:glycosyltransferase involved in cell wall biosynthesis
MLEWVRNFNPDVIFAQGYSLAFSWLPLMLKRRTGAKLAFLATDDWPTYLYSGQLGELKCLAWLVRPVVKRSAAEMMSALDIPFGFGQPMTDEYSARYGKRFIAISHADQPGRFEQADPARLFPSGIFEILAIGNFNKYRWPLLLDANECCRRLDAQGIRARIAVLSWGIDPVGALELAKAKYVDLLPDPGNERLPGYLKGADVLLLAEGFDEGFVSAIRLSVSSKSHLFMFSGCPTIVYSHADTGVAKYAKGYGWARVVSDRNVATLTNALRDVLTNAQERNRLVCRAAEIARTSHSREAVQATLLSALSNPHHFAG